MDKSKCMSDLELCNACLYFDRTTDQCMPEIKKCKYEPYMICEDCGGDFWFCDCSEE